MCFYCVVNTKEEKNCEDKRSVHVKLRQKRKKLFSLFSLSLSLCVAFSSLVFFAVKHFFFKPKKKSSS